MWVVMIRVALLALIALHALLHGLGVAKAFGLASLEQLEQPVSRPLGILWGVAGMTLLVSVAAAVVAPSVWGILCIVGVGLSQVVIITSWRDARYGTLVNVVVLLGGVHGVASQGPVSFHAEYDRNVAERTANPEASVRIESTDLSTLPEPVRCYMRAAGVVVGGPAVTQFAASWRGRIRSGPSEPWMSFTAEQYNVVSEPARFFLLDATRSGVPVEVLHTFASGAANMRVRVASMVPVVTASGSEMTRAETVTLLNDMAVLAPASLLTAADSWEDIDEHSARVSYTVGDNQVSALLVFDDDCALVDFVSDDRLRASDDGTDFTRQRWSTPLSDHRLFGSAQAPGRGEGVWHDPEGAFTYMEVELLELRLGGTLR